MNSNVTELAEALKISAEFKKAVNDRYKLLEIDLDGVFQRLLLLQKKKYAAVKVEDAGRTSVEVKGLDMKRREYCALSKAVSQYVLEQILSGEATETVVENIHEYLATMSGDVRAGKVKMDEFIIYKVGRRHDLESSLADTRAAATGQEPRGLPRCQVAAARPGRAAHEGEGQHGALGQRHPVHLLFG